MGSVRRSSSKPNTAAAIGIDFGTTNSSIALVSPSGGLRLTQFTLLGEPTESYRSLLYLEQYREKGRLAVKSWSGPAGIERYLDGGDHDHEGSRLMQSLKSFLSSKSLKATDVFGQKRTLEQLISRILSDLRMEAERQFGVPVTSVTIGRPVRFVGSDNDEGDAYAEGRLREACRLAGFESVHFELEPVAAAHYYASTLDHDELILIGDFGGGTSDFSLVRVGPGGTRILGNAGLGLAGDAFDAKIVRHAVSPALGAGSSIRSVGGKILPAPTWLYANLERWHHLSFLKTKEVANLLQSVRAQSLEPDRIDALIHLIDSDAGYRLHRAVQKTKVALSAFDEAEFQFQDMRSVIRRADFEVWIADELRRIEDAIDGLLQTSAIGNQAVDRVFLTGGTSFVPAVRRIFERRFGGSERIRAGNEFTSVARGLALHAAEKMF